jgi:hypothetical protein
MKINKYLFGITLWASLAISASAAQELKNKDAICLYNADMHCEVQFNMRKSASAYYRVQQFDPSQRDWVILDDVQRPWQTGDTVEGGHFYRVVGCNDVRGSAACKTSRLFWAPIIIPENAIPSRVQMLDEDGSPSWATVSADASLDEKLRQLNVYKMLYGLALVDGQMDANDMTSPVPHSHDPGFPHTENLIHHAVYEQYNAFVNHVRDSREQH